MFKCLECKWEGNNSRALYIHVKNTHGLSKFEYLEKYDLFNKCKICGNPVKTSRNDIQLCSPKCKWLNNKQIQSSPEHRLYLSNALKDAHSSGRHPGWSHINANPNRTSYPERVFLSLIMNAGLLDKYTIVTHLPISKYFLDFALIDYKIDIEVDGSQHVATPDAIEHDEKRDIFFTNLGWRIFRISWKELKSDRLIVLNKLQAFIDSTDKRRKYEITDIKIKPVKVTRSRKEYFESRRRLELDKNQAKIKSVLESNIDFSKFGWGTTLANLIGIKPQKTKRWMTKYLPDIWETAFKISRSK